MSIFSFPQKTYGSKIFRANKRLTTRRSICLNLRVIGNDKVYDSDQCCLLEVCFGVMRQGIFGRGAVECGLKIEPIKDDECLIYDLGSKSEKPGVCKYRMKRKRTAHSPTKYKLRNRKIRQKLLTLKVISHKLWEIRNSLPMT